MEIFLLAVVHDALKGKSIDKARNDQADNHHWQPHLQPAHRGNTRFGNAGAFCLCNTDHVGSGTDVAAIASQSNADRESPPERFQRELPCFADLPQLESWLW